MPYSWLDALLDVVLAPALWLGVLLAVIYGLLFTAWRGGGWRQVPRDLLAALVGFAGGQLVSVLLRVEFLRVGELRLPGATAGAVIALLAGRLIVQRLSGHKVAVRPKGRTSA